MSTSVHVAVDLGAESGRAVVGVLSAGGLETAEVHRFVHGPVALPSGLHWDITGLWREIVAGLARAGAWCRERGLRVQTVGVDTWGVDFGLIGEGGELLGAPHCYRDPRNEAAYRRVLAEVGEEAIYGATGIQFMALNTLYQLAAMREASPGMLDRARRLLFMPDLFHYWLSGEMVVERSIASTSQMYDPTQGRWSEGLLRKVGVSAGVMGEPVEAGTVVGRVRREVLEAAGLEGEVLVVTPAGHDTACAVAAAPADGKRPWAYLSSGTWSLMGVELRSPVVTEAARRAPFTNELGVGGTVRFLKNIAGLWLVQEVRRGLALRGVVKEYAELAAEAEGSEGLRTLVDVDWGPLAGPGRMIEKLGAYAAATGQPAPETPGALVRCCLDSLALAYDRVRARIGEVTGTAPGVLHVVGGGGRNNLLNRLTAWATGMEVRVGPYEATAIGNLLVQAMGVGRVSGVEGVRRIVSGMGGGMAGVVNPKEVGAGMGDVAGARARYAGLTGGSGGVEWAG